MKVKGNGIGKDDHANWQIKKETKQFILVLNEFGVVCYRYRHKVRKTDRVLKLNILERI